MTNAPLTSGTVLHHTTFGKGKIICQYEDGNVGDMVEVHWYAKNEVLDHREENLRFGLTAIQPPATTSNLWAALANEEK